MSGGSHAVDHSACGSPVMALLTMITQTKLAPKILKLTLVELTEKRRYQINRTFATARRTYRGPYATVKASAALFKLGCDGDIPGWKIGCCVLTKKAGGVGDITVTYIVKINAGTRAALLNLTGKNNRKVKGVKG